jgi:hypothetical protein
MGAAVTAPRRTAVHPALAVADAREAAKAAAAVKARRAPHLLSEAEVMLLPGKTVLDLGNAGHLRHLGIGIPPTRTAVPKKTASKPASAQLTDDDLARMSGTDISKAMSAGRVPGIGPRRRGRRH